MPNFVIYNEYWWGQEGTAEADWLESLNVPLKRMFIYNEELPVYLQRTDAPMAAKIAKEGIPAE